MTLDEFKAKPAPSDDLLDRLQRAIDEAEHKPGQWETSITAMGAICTKGTQAALGVLDPKNWSSFTYKRDAWLAIAAVNALPELMKRVRSAEGEIERLRATMPAATPCCGDPGDCAKPCEVERKPSAKLARALEQAREIRERWAGDDLPAGLSWEQAPEWAVTLICRSDGQFAWAGWREGAMVTTGTDCISVIGQIDDFWTIIAHRPS